MKYARNLNLNLAWPMPRKLGTKLSSSWVIAGMPRIPAGQRGVNAIPSIRLPPYATLRFVRRSLLKRAHISIWGNLEHAQETQTLGKCSIPGATELCKWLSLCLDSLNFLVHDFKLPVGITHHHLYLFKSYRVKMINNADGLRAHT